MRQRFHRRGTEMAEMDTLIQHIARLAGDVQRLAREAEQQYSVEVETILKARICDSRRIERCLDGMLDFCFSRSKIQPGSNGTKPVCRSIGAGRKPRWPITTCLPVPCSTRQTGR
ncbi:MAG: hypothetical protein JRJ42_07360 [Deltaproteobacteria bacterium]|nr:hypothetical protein [Deltaproteobacteria bacterium]MBW2074780.1 hypothetical protein [Deltaproteobacteria bacterium]